MAGGEADLPRAPKAHTRQSGLNNRKLDSQVQPHQPPIRCPKCTSQRVWKDGIRYTNREEIQRYICRSCGFRFSETTTQPIEKLDILKQRWLKTLQSGPNLTKAPMRNPYFSLKEIPNDLTLPASEDVSAHYPSLVTVTGKSLNILRSHKCNSRVCVSEGEMKNLAEAESRQERAAGATKPTEADIKGKLIEHAWWMRKQGYAEATIVRRTRLLKTLAKRGADLFDPESVKSTIARQQGWSLKTKQLSVDAYTCFLRMLGGEWEPPRYKPARKLPFIPTEQEIDSLIAGCNRKTAAFLQLLKETGMRSGEAWGLKWIDFDLENRIVKITPEKGGDPRALKMSNKLIAMLNTLPKNQPEVFKGSLRHFGRSFRRQRKGVAHKLQNERIKKIAFHTLRHWKATMEYAQTKDILHVMKLLGHRSVQNTLMYTQLVNFESDEFHSAVAKSVEEAQKLVEAGFEYVCDFDGVKLFRKRK